MVNTLALITARGGSKSIPCKNILEVANKPLIAHTIIAAQEAESIDRIVVTTNCSKIGAIARHWGAEVPFERPEELARDDTPSIPVVIHALEWLRTHQRYDPDYIVLLQPTSPLRMPQDIDAAVQMAYERAADSVVSVRPVKDHPTWMMEVNDQGKMQPWIGAEKIATHRQYHSSLYVLNGAIYVVRPEVLISRQQWYAEETYPYVMPTERSVDIDDRWHLQFVESILRERENCKNQPRIAS